ncbi:hypothetical protein CERZMDRAFT_90699 [Cercospora zeae-maydis SCOH1-5]|uniref:Uncharacterized protein n=1 Tax=Cercospora zeae-maydis SCOH1-5 TaxID=717836 RepID=A0A6A6FFH9_9PEZI|nr:hypothetical protein CERZMDRAFT_90699 [Cercospora zeae-maydis SCOH1-5]
MSAGTYGRREKGFSDCSSGPARANSIRTCRAYAVLRRGAQANKCLASTLSSRVGCV